MGYLCLLIRYIFGRKLLLNNTLPEANVVIAMFPTSVQLHEVCLYCYLVQCPNVEVFIFETPPVHVFILLSHTSPNVEAWLNSVTEDHDDDDDTETEVNEVSGSVQYT